MQLRVIDGSARGLVYPLNAEHIIIGRTSPGVVRSDDFVHVDDDTVSRLHAELAWNDERQCYTLVNRSETNPTQVNDIPIEQLEVRAGDRIRMGECLLTLESSSASKRPVALTQRPALALHGLQGCLAGQQIAVTGFILALGGPPDPATAPAEKKPKWFDQEIVFEDAELPPRCLSLTWKELLNAFELARVDSCALEVSVQRSAGGLSWVAQLPSGNTGLVRADDVISVGKHQFQVTVAEV